MKPLDIRFPPGMAEGEVQNYCYFDSCSRIFHGGLRFLFCRRVLWVEAFRQSIDLMGLTQRLIFAPNSTIKNAMTTQSFDDLMKQLGDTPEGRALHLAVAFLAQVNARMQAQGMSNAELARRMGTSAAYVTKLFRGNVNLSLQTMAKLAIAVNATVHLSLAEAGSVAVPKHRTPTSKKAAAMQEASRDGLDKKSGRGEALASALII